MRKRHPIYTHAPLNAVSGTTSIPAIWKISVALVSLPTDLISVAMTMCEDIAAPESTVSRHPKTPWEHVRPSASDREWVRVSV